MRNIKYIATRLLQELKTDRRTLGLLLGAPVILLIFINILFGSEYTTPDIGIYNTSEYAFEIKQADTTEVASLAELKRGVKSGEYDYGVAINTKEQTINPDIDSSQLPLLIQNQLQNGIKVDTPIFDLYKNGENPLYDVYNQSLVFDNIELGNQKIIINSLNYDYDSLDYSMMLVMEFLVMFFAYITVGINFLRERKNKTMQRLLLNRVKPSEIVLGYLLGFGLVAIVQSVIIQLMMNVVLNLQLTSNLGLSILMNVFFALFAIALGMLLSSFASNEFQIMQFIPLVIIPQLVFSGILPYDGLYATISKVSPLTYATDAQIKLLLQDNINIVNDALIIIVICVIICLLTIYKVSKERTL